MSSQAGGEDVEQTGDTRTDNAFSRRYFLKLAAGAGAAVGASSGLATLLAAFGPTSTAMAANAPTTSVAAAATAPSTRSAALDPTGDGMTTIDIEAHWITPELQAALENVVPKKYFDASVSYLRTNVVAPLDFGPERITNMDAQGVDMQVVSVAPPGTGPLRPADAVSFSRELNDLVIEKVKANPTRFRALATLPMAKPRAVAGELERAVRLGCVGAMVYGRTKDTMLDDPCYDDLFATAEDLNVPIQIHPQIPTNAVRNADYSGFDDATNLALSTYGWGWHVEGGIAVLRLILRGTFKRYPNLKVVLGHWGELLLFWAERIDTMKYVVPGLLNPPPSYYLFKNVYFTSSGMLNAPLLNHSLAETNIDHLLFSLDYPYSVKWTKAMIDPFVNNNFASDEDRAKFRGLNALDVYGIQV